VRLTATDGTVIYARTMESAVDFLSNLIIVPRGKPYVGLLAEKTAGLKWTTKFGFVGPNAFGLPYICDGLNEQGLAVGHFVFTGFAQYQARPADTSRSIDCAEVGTFLLGTCRDVPEAVKTLRSVCVVQAGSTPGELAAHRYHYFVHDAQGRCAVIEYVAGQMHVHDNPLGVLTNSPPFDWHLINLRNYVHLEAENAAPRQLGHLVFSGFGQGTGLIGLPGDFTPPSRFIRAVTFTQAALPAANGEDCVRQVFHLLNQFDIPLGAVRAHENGKPSLECTRWTTASDMQHGRYYYHTYQSRRTRVVDLGKLDFGGTAVKTIPMREPEVIEDVTTQAK
jgi:choloylglycine hydrolase